MRPTLITLLALLAAPGCDKKTAAVDDGGPARDAAPSEAAPGDAAPLPDGLGVLSVSLSKPGSSSLPIGRHLVLKLTASPSSALRPFTLRAGTCRLKLKGTSAPPAAALELDLPAAAPTAQLVLFAPPDAKPGAACAPSSTDARVKLQALALTVAAPTYKVLNLGDHAVSAIDGMQVTTIGALGSATYRIQALTWAGGSFKGAWFAASGDKGDTPVTKGTLRLYRFTDKPAASISPWLDLAGKTTSPTAVEDMIWSPLGPCPLSQDALYLGASGSDASSSSADGDAGGVYCVDATKQLQTIYDEKARTLDVDTTGGFISAGAKGGLYVSRWGGYRVFPGAIKLTDPALPASSSGHLRFARAGPIAGHLYAIGVTTGHPLVRISPAPHKATSFVDLSTSGSSSDHGIPALNHTGAFGELLVVARHNPAQWRKYTLVAYFHEGGKVRQLELIKQLDCGRAVAFDAQGQRLAVVTAASQCDGAKTAHVFSFVLP